MRVVGLGELVIMEHTMRAKVEFPEMRAEVVGALRALSDPDYQRTRWGRYVDGVDYYDDLDLNIHILYDDCQVLPSPERAVPQILHEDEIPVLLAVEAALGPMIRELGDRPDAEDVADPRWAGVLSAAGVACAVLQDNDEGGRA